MIVKSDINGNITVSNPPSSPLDKISRLCCGHRGGRAQGHECEASQRHGAGVALMHPPGAPLALSRRFPPLLQRLRDRAATNPERYEDMFLIVTDDCAELPAGKFADGASVTKGMLWLKRCAPAHAARPVCQHRIDDAAVAVEHQSHMEWLCAVLKLHMDHLPRLHHLVSV